MLKVYLLLIIIMVLQFVVTIVTMSQSVSYPHTLINLGSSCYMNSLIQCLYQIQSLTDLLISQKASSFYKSNSLSLKFIEFIKKFSSKKITIQDQEELEQFIIEKYFGGENNQQDSLKKSPGITRIKTLFTVTFKVNMKFSDGKIASTKESIYYLPLKAM